MTWWLGLTGGIGSGKSAAARAFADLGVPVIDTDAIAHALTAADGAALPAIHHQFGAAVFQPDGNLNRAALRQQVFDHPEQKQALERILHPMIFQAVQTAQRQTAASTYGVVEIPLLAEAPLFQRLVDRVLLIDCPESCQIARVAARSGLNEAAIRAIIAQQASRQQRLALADDVIVNDGSPDQLRAAVARLHHGYGQAQ